MLQAESNQQDKKAIFLATELSKSYKESFQMRALNPLWSSIVLAAVCTQAQGITLSEAIQSTLDNHPEVHAGANSRLSSDEEVKIAKGGYLPTVDLLMGYGRENTDSPSTRALGNHNTETLNYGTSELRLRQMIFDGFNTPNEVERTKAVVNSACAANKVLAAQRTWTNLKHVWPWQRTTFTPSR